MPEQKFAAGAPVKHKSGGPVMIVLAYDVWELHDTEKKYKCRWFEGKQVKEFNFTEAELEASEPPAKPRIMFEVM